MSVLLIKYAMNYCTVDQVTEVFNEIFDKDIVEFVKELVQTDRYSHKQYKMFFIHFKKNRIGTVFNLVECNARDEFIARLEKTKTVNIIYDEPHYWKVCIAETREVVKKVKVPPRIMSADEEIELGLTKVKVIEEGEIYFDSEDTVKGDDKAKGDTVKGDTVKGDTVKGDTVKGDTVKGGIIVDTVISDKDLVEIMAEMKLEKRYIELSGTAEVVEFEQQAKKKKTKSAK